MTRTLRTTIILLTSLALFSCTSYRSYKRGMQLEQEQNWDEAVVAYTNALEVDPDNPHYKIALNRAKLEASRHHFDKGKTYFAAGQYDLAALEFELTVKLDPTNQFAAVELGKALARLQEARLGPQRTLEEMKRDPDITKAQPPVLNPGSDEPISLSFPRETNVKDIYKSLGNAFGINVLFDQGVKDDRISIELRDVTAQQALERVMQAAGHFYKVLDEKSIIVVPDNPQARRDYEDLVIRTFYLSNGDAEQVTNVVRTMIEARNVFPLKALNAITIRDTADKVRIAEKIIEANDKAKAEVVVQVELLQVDSTRLRDIGGAISLGGGQVGAGVFDSTGAAITNMTLEEIGNLALDNFTFTIPSAGYNFVKGSTDAKLLARPQLRISEGEKATLHIGQKQPIPVSTLFTSTVPGQNQGPITSFNYQDVGIKISLEPRVHHNREVTLKLIVEVSNIASFVEPPAGSSSPRQPIIGTRTIESTIRLKDGETNFLAGLYRYDDSNTRSETPFLGDLPIIGRLFTGDRVDRATQDLVLTMTPHIIRIPDVTADDLAPMWVGTQNNMTFRGMSPRVESRSAVDPFNSFPRTQADGVEDPAAQQQLVDPNVPPPAPQQIPTGAPPADPFAPNRPVQPPPPVPQQQDEQLNQQMPNWQGTPRIGLQPAIMEGRPGQEALWRLVGMDLSGLSMSHMTIRFTPGTLAVLDVVIGPALRIDPQFPPVVKIDHDTGVISVTSSDGAPLGFEAGGDILGLRVLGGGPGETIFVIDELAVIDSEGREVAANVTGGRMRVQ